MKKAANRGIMPFSRARLHRFELPSALLERGFWLYLWKIQTTKKDKPKFYVGMTGDTGSYSAQSPMNRVSGHLSSNKYANALRKWASDKKIDLEACCCIDLAAFGPISEVPTVGNPKTASEPLKEKYRSERAKIAALEKALWVALDERGCEMLNKCPDCRTHYNVEHLSAVLKAFQPILD